MRRRQIKFEHDEDDDPMSVVSNLFDAAMVFAVALMVALVTHYKMTEMFSTENFTVVKNPGKQNMEIISKKGKQIERYTPSKNQDAKSSNKGKRVGTAYQLENGEIIYIPDEYPHWQHTQQYCCFLKTPFLQCKSMVFGVQKPPFCNAKRGFLSIVKYPAYTAQTIYRAQNVWQRTFRKA